MPPRRKPVNPNLEKLAARVRLWKTLASMCARNWAGVIAGHEDLGLEEIRDLQHEPTWLPYASHEGGIVELLKTECAERDMTPVGFNEKTGNLKMQQAVRLTAKGREAAARFFDLWAEGRKAEAIGVLCAAFGVSDAVRLGAIAELGPAEVGA